ncbi:ATP-dependent RNA helicase DHX58-like [Mya arenaria]|uniref:ATP-dependent RNA helicase DHX58-like n=1 Tax=Mya arenaria TaxID=6604 RepID=UPI0022E8DADB|nr:ATP-dependent RNA helicase DHX58-like [Mya arenaria]
MQWSSEFEHKIAQISSDDIRRVLQPCWEFLQEYNKALLVYNDARLKEALKILSEFILNVKKVQTYHSTDNFLLELYTGMTKVAQKDVLGFFKKGVHRLIIATSVAEEGLDIAQCNLVIRYMHVTNEIVRLQSRGRARAEKSKYFVIAEKGSPTLAKELKNELCENLMIEIVPKLQRYLESPENHWDKEMLDMQKVMKDKEEQMERERLKHLSDDACEFQCMKCSSSICLSEDIRTIKGAHHIVVNIDVNKKIKLQRGEPAFIEPDDVKYGGKIFCIQKDCQKELGTLCTYESILFPVIKLTLFEWWTKQELGKSTRRGKNLIVALQSYRMMSSTHLSRKEKLSYFCEHLIRQR